MNYGLDYLVFEYLIAIIEMNIHLSSKIVYFCLCLTILTWFMICL